MACGLRARLLQHLAESCTEINSDLPELREQQSGLTPQVELSSMANVFDDKYELGRGPNAKVMHVQLVEGFYDAALKQIPIQNHYTFWYQPHLSEGFSALRYSKVRNTC